MPLLPSHFTVRARIYALPVGAAEGGSVGADEGWQTEKWLVVGGPHKELPELA